MAITIRNITEEQIETAKELTGKGTASAGVVACVDIAARQKEIISRQDKEIADLRERLRHANGVFERLANAADEALCIVRQKELLR